MWLPSVSRLSDKISRTCFVRLRFRFPQSAFLQTLHKFLASLEMLQNTSSQYPLPQSSRVVEPRKEEMLSVSELCVKVGQIRTQSLGRLLAPGRQVRKLLTSQASLPKCIRHGLQGRPGRLELPGLVIGFASVPAN
jgi:hypothetical protein